MSELHTTTGATVAITTDAEQNRIITVSHPDAPEDLRTVTLGRVARFEGSPPGFQPAPLLGLTGALLSAEVLRAVATLVDAENV